MKEKNEILQSLIDYYCGGNKRQFAFMIGLNPSSVSTWLLRNTFNANILIAKCKSINPAYLLTGEGPMLLSEDDSQVQTHFKNNIERDKNLQVNELLSTAHLLQELVQKNVQILEKSQQQFDRVLDLFDKVVSLQKRNTSYNDMAAEPGSPQSDAPVKEAPE